MAPNEAKLIGEILDGNLDSLTVLFESYEKRLLRYAASIVKEQDDAQDVVQQAMIKAYQNLRTYDQKRSFSTWIYRIVRNESLNWLRKEKKYIGGEAAEKIIEMEKSDQIPDREMELKETQEAVRESLTKLPLKYREPVMLYYIEDRKYEEISDILRLPINTVATRIRRGKEYLKKIYLKDHE
ncbi:sigma-70 family RNA polymerase sigma factor [Candidatus Berkelbacteria bacterium]|nr:sigma-70 family RNA polymerase sigma factor [Candidatus Berkelbacteria bacterium]